MSLCIAYLNEKYIRISADSRSSILVGEKNYADNDNVNKIEQVNDKVIFKSGSVFVIGNIIDKFKASDDQSIENLQFISKEEVQKFAREHPEIYAEYHQKNRILELLIATFENEVGVIYNISANNDFKIIRAVGEKRDARVLLGAYTPYIYNNFKTHSTFELLHKVYESVASENIGGYHEHFELKKDKITYKKMKIKDRKTIKRYSDFIHMNGTEGLSIEKNVGTFDNPEWIKQLYADLDGVLHAKAIKVSESLFLDGGIEGSYIILRDDVGGVMKLYPSVGLHAGSENAEDAPLWITPQGKLKLKGKNGQFFVDTEEGFMDLDTMDIRGAGKIQAESIQVNTLIAGEAVINDLTVNHLSTMIKEPNIGEYVDYIDIQGKAIKFITGKVSGKTHASDTEGRKIYWTNSDKKYQTFEVTAYPFYEYSLTDVLTKDEQTFTGSGTTAQSMHKIGAGDGGPNDRAKVVITKHTEGYKTNYTKRNTGEERSIDIRDDGIYVLSENERIQIDSKDAIVMVSGSARIEHDSGYKFEVSNATGIKFTDNTGSTFTMKDGQFNFN